MKELNAKQEQFYTKWKERRNKKFLYIFLHGAVYSGIPTGILLFILISYFNKVNINLSGFIIFVTFFGISGLFSGLKQYKRIDERYLEINEDNTILEGIRMLSTEKVWNYENIVINKEENETLVVKNKLFWLEDSKTLSGDLEECLNIVMNDFKRLKKHPDFDVFSSKYKVKVQVYNNSEKEKPLIEMIM